MKISELLVDETKWTRGTLARLSIGNLPIPDVCEPENPSACCWCLMGAMLRCVPREPSFDAVKRAAVSLVRARIGTLLAEVIKELYPLRVVGLREWHEIIAGFNDSPGTCFEDVRKVIETADV